jgi:hypothetical protein
MNPNFFPQHGPVFFSWQKKFWEIWLDSLSGGSRQIIQNNLACQEMVMKAGINFQLLYWDSYFQLMGQMFPQSQPMDEQTLDRSRDPDAVRSLIGGSLHPANTQANKIEVILDSNSNLS